MAVSSSLFHPILAIDLGTSGLKVALVYGLAATLPAREAVGDILKRYIDLLYEI